MRRTARWSDRDGRGLEHCVLERDETGLTLEGVVAGTRKGRHGARYRVRTDAGLRTREVLVRYVGGPELHVVADAEGRWTDALRDEAIESLDGCLDVDIGVTPATNALPIARLRLEAGRSADIVAAYVPLPSEIEGAFLPRAARQRYTCLEPGRRYRYKGLFRSFVADLDIDEAGLVLDYPDTFRRVDDP